MTSYWWTIEQKGEILPFFHKNKLDAICEFISAYGGEAGHERGLKKFPPQLAKLWKILKKKGYRSVQVAVSPVTKGKLHEPRNK